MRTEVERGLWITGSAASGIVPRGGDGGEVPEWFLSLHSGFFPASGLGCAAAQSPAWPAAADGEAFVSLRDCLPLPPAHPGTIPSSVYAGGLPD